jgi:hypothetical protein
LPPSGEGKGDKRGEDDAEQGTLGISPEGISDTHVDFLLGSLSGLAHDSIADDALEAVADSDLLDLFAIVLGLVVFILLDLGDFGHLWRSQKRFADAGRQSVRGEGKLEEIEKDGETEEKRRRCGVQPWSF